MKLSKVCFNIWITHLWFCLLRFIFSLGSVIFPFILPNNYSFRSFKFEVMHLALGSKASIHESREKVISVVLEKFLFLGPLQLGHFVISFPNLFFSIIQISCKYVFIMRITELKISKSPSSLLRHKDTSSSTKMKFATFFNLIFYICLFQQVDM